MRIAIVGTGISGTTLALRLQQLGVETTVFAEKSQDDIRGGRLLNTVARFEHTLARERELGVDLWSDAAYAMTSLQFRSIDPLPLSFVGRPAHPVRAVDFRVLLPAFLDAYEERGGTVVEAREPDLAAISRDHDLVVVAVGRRSAALFPVRPDRSPYSAPQRVLFAGIFDGLALPDPLGLSFNIAPGVGEIFQMPILTADGLSTNILIEAIPGGPLAVLAELAPDDPAFVPTLRGLLETYAPAIAERIDPSTFALRSTRDALQGALTPAVRDACRHAARRHKRSRDRRRVDHERPDDRSGREHRLALRMGGRGAHRNRGSVRRELGTSRRGRHVGVRGADDGVDERVPAAAAAARDRAAARRRRTPGRRRRLRERVRRPRPDGVDARGPGADRGVHRVGRRLRYRRGVAMTSPRRVLARFAVGPRPGPQRRVVREGLRVLGLRDDRGRGVRRGDHDPPDRHDPLPAAAPRERG